MKLDQVTVKNTHLPHFEDLGVARIVNFIDNMGQYEFNEKVDGSNIFFGKDEDGFYTRRATGPKYYSVDDYPINFATTYQRYAHVVLEKHIHNMPERFFRWGDEVLCEVLYGNVPNVVPYNTDHINKIVMLEASAGSPMLANIVRGFNKTPNIVMLTIPKTTDGKTTEYVLERSSWKLSNHNGMCGSAINQDFASYSHGLKPFLESYSGVEEFTYYDIFTLPLNKRHPSVKEGQWRKVSRKIKECRERNKDTLAKLIEGVKDDLLATYVDSASSVYGPYFIHGGWIEGVVFTNRRTNDKFKLVDKKTFLKAKDFLWEERSSLTKGVLSLKQENHSFMGSVKLTLASSLGMSELGTIHAKRYINENLVLPNHNFDGVKVFWCEYLDGQIEALDEKLAMYEQDRTFKTLQITEGMQFVYSDEIHSRTLQVYATCYEKLNEYIDGARKAENINDLVKVLVGV